MEATLRQLVFKWTERQIHVTKNFEIGVTKVFLTSHYDIGDAKKFL